ncbi:SIR2 family NAD-dependent protein deacylase [Neptunomonas qingdaonensis]|uniref:SIR2-like domain-containing protein n=1 Tax=Neptunomonas qingdaonensis TaxID=1045558 RepID=A0A1I2SNW3_9GAMM|nr:SIR2 family protein [Neptunomonas qingdaonensis]SFG51886.1 SIR2-like domain-containing protein [Neptunomonas qingdaonensis]
MNKEVTENKNIINLPDYTTLKKLSAALWQQDNAYHGAAVMVGAGFSRSAASTGDINSTLPLWYDLSKILAEELGANSNSDPLRLAEEYSAYFGKQALLDLVKKEVNDEAWIPGELHKLLLEFPWSEVLTTNWDTLLECASKKVHQPVYSVVSRQEDLSRFRSPRIVKLHGTINVTEDLIFTQEDYRKYPQSHAAFVNFTRQVFIENELCLLGFSGDDPNFLQWTGWVRDQLATNSRRIYLVGALNLTVAKRKYLESINIAPIDLTKLVTHYDNHDTKHLEATKIFFQTLQHLKPKPVWEWHPTQLQGSTITTEEQQKTFNNPEYAAALLEKQLPLLETDRKSYPGWLVCPSMLRQQLQSQINTPFPSEKNLSKMAPDSRAKLLYEIAWRASVTYDLVRSWNVKEMLEICDPAKPCALTKKQQMEIALLLLKSTRWATEGESKNIRETTIAILERDTKHWPESADELAYFQAIVARDKFDFPSIEKNTQKITNRDPIWKLKKASLLAEMGRFDEGKKLIAGAYHELLGQYRNDRNSIYILSRLAWAEWLLRGVEIWSPETKYRELPSLYQNIKCAPLDHIEFIKEKIAKALENQLKREEIEPSFEPGRYKDHSKTVTFNTSAHPLLLIDGILGSAGMPLRWNNVSFITEAASRLVQLHDIDFIHRFSLAIRAMNSDQSHVLTVVFSRTNIANLTQNAADYLLDRCIQAIKYWSSEGLTIEKNNTRYAIDRLRVFIEVLARASVRATPEQAKVVFRLATELGNNEKLNHFWLFDALSHMITYALKSIPKSQHHELLFEALSFPLQTETSISNHENWPNPVIEFPGNRSQNNVLDRRIDEIIDSIAPCGARSSPALIRLLPLIMENFLTAIERDRIAEKIWGKSPDFQNIPETGLLKYVLLKLPSQNHSAVRNLVRKFLFEASDSNLFYRGLLLDIINAATAEGEKEYPNEEQASINFERLVVWRKIQKDADPFGFNDQEEIGSLIGEALSKSIVPSLSTTLLTEENFKKLYSFYVEVGSAETIIEAFLYFAKANNHFVERVESIIRQGLQTQNANKIAYSSYALLKWRDIGNSETTTRLTLRLIYLIGSRITGLAALLGTANEMYNKDYLSGNETESLIEALPIIFDNTDYRNISPSSKEAVSASLIRAAIVRLTRDILKTTQSKNSELLRILQEAKKDALPEVRFAEFEM